MTAPRPAAPIDVRSRSRARPARHAVPSAAAQTGGFFGRPGFGTGLDGRASRRGPVRHDVWDGMFGGMGGSPLHRAVPAGGADLRLGEVRRSGILPEPAAARHGRARQRQAPVRRPARGRHGRRARERPWRHGPGPRAIAAQGRPVLASLSTRSASALPTMRRSRKTLLGINAAWDREDIDGCATLRAGNGRLFPRGSRRQHPARPA